FGILARSRVRGPTLRIPRRKTDRRERDQLHSPGVCGSSNFGTELAKTLHSGQLEELAQGKRVETFLKPILDQVGTRPVHECLELSPVHRTRFTRSQTLVRCRAPRRSGNQSRSTSGPCGLWKFGNPEMRT